MVHFFWYKYGISGVGDGILYVYVGVHTCMFAHTRVHVCARRSNR